MRVSSPYPNWMGVYWSLEEERPVDAIQRLAQIPGVKFGEVTKGFVELPRNVWHLEPAQRLFEAADHALLRGHPAAWAPSFTPKEPLFPHQQEAVQFIANHRGALLADAMGLGKQQPVDTKVLTPHGWRLIGDLRPGDFVIGSDGQATRVRAVFPQGVQPSYRLWFSDGSSVEAGDEHLWRIAHKCGGKRWEELVVTTHELRTGAAIRIDRGTGKFSTLVLRGVQAYLPLLGAPVVFDAAPPRPIDAYTLGQLIANGSLANGGALLSTNAEDWAHVRSRVQGDLGVPHSYPGCVRVSFRGLLPALRALGLTVHSRDKFLPGIYLRATPEERVALLQGLMDADGSISKTRNRVVYHTTSLRLAEDVRELVEGLGGIASVRQYDRVDPDGQQRTNYTVRVRCPDGVAPFSVPRKLVRWRPGSRSVPRRTFQYAEYVRDVDSVCIEVEAEDNLYATEHAILTHNTRSALVGAKELAAGLGLGNRPLLIVAPVYTRETWFRECQAIGILNDRSQFWAMKGRSHADPQWDADVWFTHYEILKDWRDVFTVNRRGRPGVVIFDEAHRLRNGRSQQGKAAQLAAGLSTARILLTGTPLANKPSELWHLLTLLDGPWTWGSPISFRQRYCGAYRDEYGWVDTAPTNTTELHDRLQMSYLRRTKEDVGLELPPLFRRTYYVDAAQDELAQHHVWDRRRLADLFHFFVSGGNASRETMTMLDQLRKLTSRAKRKATADVLLSTLEQQQSAVCFCWQRQTVEQLAAAIDKRASKAGMRVRVMICHGGVSQKARDAMVDEFQRAEQPTVLVSTFETLKEGVTLTAAAHVVLHDMHWAPDVVLQAEARVYRIGQTKGTMSTWMLLRDSMDELILAAFVEKARAQREMLGFGATQELLDQLGLSQTTNLEVEAQRLLAAWEEVA